MPTLTDLAMNDQHSIRQLADPLANLVERQVDRTRDATALELGGRAHIDENRAVGPGVRQFMPLDAAGRARAQVVGHVAGEVDGILRRTELGRIGELEAGER